jgi:hypothetical protein
MPEGADLNPGNDRFASRNWHARATISGMMFLPTLPSSFKPFGKGYTGALGS